MGTGLQRVASVFVVMLMWAVLPGCSGDGGSDPAAVSQNPGTSPQNPSNPPSSPTPGGNLPPTTGTFGGGQGKILFAEGGLQPYAISEFDLATRQVRRLVDYSQDNSLKPVLGGVSRANDGSFTVVRDPGPGASAVILHYQADGSLLHEWTVPKQRTPGAPNNLFGLGESPRGPFTEGGALSPDAKSIALVAPTRFGLRLEVVTLDVQSGTFDYVDVLRANDAPSDKTNMRASTFWSPSGELYVLSNVGLHKVDRATGVGTLVHQVPLKEPHAPTMSSDGRSIYFSQCCGNPNGGSIWSMDVASGEVTRRSTRSVSGQQSSPALSPDGEWLLLQEAGSSAVLIFPGLGPNPIGALGIPFNISAVRLSDPPIDTQNLNIWIVDAAGQPHFSQSRMVWF